MENFKSHIQKEAKKILENPIKVQVMEKDVLIIGILEDPL